MNSSYTLLIVIVAFFVGFFLVSKLIDFLSNKKDRNINSNTSFDKEKLNQNDFTNNSSRSENNISDKTILSILTLVGKFEPNPVDENFDKKLSTINKFLDINFSSEKIDREKIIKVIFYAKNSDTTLDQVLYMIKSLRKNDFVLYKKITKLLLDISLVDGNLSADEELTIVKICIEFDIADSNAYKSYKEDSYSETNSPDNFFTQSDKDKYYGKVLGLVGQISKNDIIKRYKDLVVKYHPDKVSHLGKEFQLLADIKIKEINSAYDYLKRRYNIN